MSEQKLTPMMKQYFEIKSRYSDPDTILFFRLGDFYEMFFEDAEVASKILDIALTSRNKNNENPVPLCGIPFHSADNYISKLLNSGKKIAICEQVENPAEAKGIVKRDVIRVITPGTVTEPDNLEAHKNNFLAAINLQNNKWGFAIVDVSTGLFRATEFSDIRELNDEISRIEPSEVIVSRTIENTGFFAYAQNDKGNSGLTILDDPKFDPLKLQKIVTEAEFSKVPDSAKGAAGAILDYVEYASKEVLNHIRGIEIYETSKFMIIDESTKRNLELTKTMIDGSRYGSLLWLIDQTRTPMGARLIREWLLHPLTDNIQISERLEAVEELFKDSIASSDIEEILKKISDLERLSGRIAMESASARDLISLKNSLNELPKLTEIKKEVKGLLHEIFDGLNEKSLSQVSEKIEKVVHNEPPISLRDGGIIKTGFSNELDELREISTKGKGYIASLEAEEKKKTGISSLKIRYNRVFGYYIDVTNLHKDKVPENYIRKQTLANSERYITAELKEFEDKVLGAEEKIKSLEYEIFSNLRFELKNYVNDIKTVALNIAKLDAILSFANIARKNRYVRPEIVDGTEILIKDGRHPIIEKLNTTDRFVPNDLNLDNESNRLLIITGPNMAGKSTVMRQAAIIVLMAQIGSFVPAKNAIIGITDRIFTRVGASDNIMRGQSTFMVEMQEASNILKEATDKSLIIIDEIGRGTSTFDGLAIAWAVAEYIHDKIKAKTLFATHYHELTDLELTKKSVKNFNIAVKEWNDKIIFLHKIVPGGVSHSYGIGVAKLAGLPEPVVERAKEVLANLETGELDEVGMPKFAYSKGERKKAKPDKNQLQLFHSSEESKLIQEIKNLNTDVLTPIEALNILYKLKSEI